MKTSAGFVIIQDNKILLEHPSNQSWWGTYSIPKGGIEEGETPLQAAIRELEEELDLKIDLDDIREEADGYIDYTEHGDKTYKRVYYFVVEPDEPLEVNKNNLQREEIDWAGFLSKEEAKRRIFWRFKPLLKYLDD
jgi:8-oxo-dGTP pyrophosphatase MutT (NUDIX family)